MNKPIPTIVLIIVIALAGGTNIGVTLVKIWSLEDQNSLLKEQNEIFRIGLKCAGEKPLEKEVWCGTTPSPTPAIGVHH